ncbi:MAG: urea ABC transporter permease subunit UrtB [Candidatus Binatia bacterium]
MINRRLLSACAASLWLAVAPARAASAGPPEMAQQLEALASDDSDAQRAAVNALAESGDRNFVAALEALRTENLYVWTAPDGARRLVITREKTTVDGQDAYVLSEAYAGTPLHDASGADVTAKSDTLQEVSVDRRLRAVVAVALERLKLVDPDPTVRRAAAKSLADKGDVSALPALAHAFDSERAARGAIEESYNLLKLLAPGDEDKLAAVTRLEALHSTDAVPRMRELEKGAAAPLQAAVARAIDSIQRWQKLTRIIYAVFSGLSLGSILMLMSLGLAITFGVMGVINMAHGELMMIGAYATFLTQNWFQAHLPAWCFGAYFLASIPLSFVAAGAAGYLLERSVIRFLYGRPLETLLATWGVSLILIQAARFYFGDLTAVTTASWLSGGIEVMAGVQLPYNRLFIIGFTLVCVASVYVLLLRSSAGLRIRAVTQNRAMSAAIGIATNKVDAWTFALGSGLAGMAGCALTLIGNVEPDLGQNYIVDAFIVVVTGGVGKLAGTVAAALGIGWMNTLLELVTDSAVMGKVLILALVMLFLQRRPSGLFPPTGRQVEY